MNMVNINRPEFDELREHPNQQADIVIRPDSETLGAFERRPEGGGLYKHFRLGDAIEYFEGESR